MDFFNAVTMAEQQSRDENSLSNAPPSMASSSLDVATRVFSLESSLSSIQQSAGSLVRLQSMST